MRLLKTNSLALHHYPQPTDCPAHVVLIYYLKHGELAGLYGLYSQNLTPESQRARCNMIREACLDVESLETWIKQETDILHPNVSPKNPRMSTNDTEPSSSSSTMQGSNPLYNSQHKDLKEMCENSTESPCSSRSQAPGINVNWEIGRDNGPSSTSDLNMNNSNSSSSSGEDANSSFDNALVFYPLERHGLCCFSKWIGSELTRKSPNRKRSVSPPMRKRIKTETFEDYSEVEFITDPADMEAVLVDAPKIKATLWACPFQLQMPQKYWPCLKEGGFANLESLIQHLEAAHRLPHYCPICHQTFTTAGECEEHIVEGSCDLAAETEMEGITEFQIGQLSEPLYALQPMAAQWLAVWRTLFDTAKKPVKPCSCSVIEIFVRLLRQYWSREGMGIILSFLDGESIQGKVVDGNTQELVTLNDEVLDKMVERLLHLSLPRMDRSWESKSRNELLKVLHCILSGNTQSGSSSPSSSLRC
ncbi:hypothetical protein EDB81DRAFT_805175 [Dactylonectria macrodidyma]|uniref:Uncharacterized protein n=1 Tax=Dactylonectria macrodidyma TaxID=307937 RepID=A0A9P9E8J4_9HYPO|nr:hypothetical protein EDB81DRAFT_805175 [Dactylonectria macrodidyma]